MERASTPGNGQDDPNDAVTRAYNEAVGARLRAIRRQKGLSLQDVEALSKQEFKASVLGAYERGERSLSLPRLYRLAKVYGVPMDQLLPEDGESTTPSIAWASRGATIDLNRIERLEGRPAEIVERFLRAIQLMRQDFNGRVLTIRDSDIRLLTHLIDGSEDALSDILIDLGARTGGA